eukprot:CAMPEP_0116035952 /NCGR_PEP_ID=MMETSP0321-20121206/20770_1 /TAXON_ID=163516 /ORGANISM="Leptocylindrus danicus var. danicus, Strain B650" /LENGTH=53 /DNA_ID=CAMNT_0003513075 /DNA_START=66 /DNA_END=224 /DNA_ORIENTATION=-
MTTDDVQIPTCFRYGVWSMIAPTNGKIRADPKEIKVPITLMSDVGLTRPHSLG